MIKKILFTLCTLLQLSAIAQERITSFNVTMQLDTANNMTVEENISIVAEGIRFKRGIIRKIPYNRKAANGSFYANPITVISVMQDGEPAEYNVNEKNGLLEIKIGNANKYLVPGPYKYKVIYNINNQVGFFENYDEIYWNVTGTEWNFKIDTATCKVILPYGAVAFMNKCYTGTQGNTSQNCTGVGEGNQSYFTAGNLQEYEGLTVAVGFSKGFVQPPPPPGPLEKYGIISLAIAFMTSIILYMGNAWRKHGKDHPRPTVIPRFDVPQNLSPAQVGFFHNKGILSEFFTVSLVSLAVKGFVKITEKTTTTLFIFKDTTYTIEKIKEDEIDKLPDEEVALMNALFSGSNKKITADGKYEKRFATAKTKFDSSFKDEKSLIKAGHNRKFLWVPLLLIIAFWVVISFYNFASVFLSAIWTIGLLLVPVFLSLGFSAFSAIFKLKWRYGVIYTAILVFVTAICGGIVLLDYTDFSFNTKVVVLFSFMVMLLFVAYVYLIKQPTVASVNTRAEIDGFKMYMQAAEEKQLQMFNAPAKTPELFEKLLPYAMALGVDKIWGDKFADVLQKASIDGSRSAYSPSWYHGNNFRSSNFHSIGNDIASTISKSSISPSSSGGSGGWSSGSGGGGFSGGGGGGGGGGGW